MPRRNLSNKRVLITGASSGIGWQLAIQLAAAQAKVLVVARREARLVELQQKIHSANGVCEFVVGDVTHAKTRTKLLESANERFGGLDILINNAGIGAMGRFEDASEDRLRQLFEVNFFAAAELTRAALPILKQGNQPMIVNINSVLGHRAVPLKSEYCASKFAMHGFSDSIRAELSHTDQPIDVLLVSPSTTDSEFFSSAIEDATNRNWKKGGAMPPEDVAAKTLKAIRAGKHEIILTFGGKALVWLDRLLPGLANRIVGRYG